MAKKNTVKDKLLDEFLDLSCCELEEVPVKEISVLRRAYDVDLSNNNLHSLPNNFISLTQIVKLDLSKNNLSELPENFGQLVQLKHLDLYSNQISRLPLSLANLKNLRWLDLKENPLTPSVASVAGPCSNLTDCQNCARNIVNYLTKIKKTFDEAKSTRKLAEQSESAAVPKKETQKKKKKKAEKDKNVASADSNKQSSEKSSAKNNKSKHKNNKIQKPKKGGLIRFLCNAISWFLLLIFFTVIIIPFLPHAEEILDYIKEKTGLPIQRYKIDFPLSPAMKEKVDLFVNYSRSFANNILQKYFNYSLSEVNRET